MKIAHESHGEDIPKRNVTIDSGAQQAVEHKRRQIKKDKRPTQE